MLLPSRGFLRASAIALLLASVPLGLGARAGEEASAFIVELGQQAIGTMTNSAISSGDRVRRFGVIVDRDFDIPKIAQFMLGHYWQNATATERDDFRTVFRDYVVRIYSDNFGKFNSTTFRVIDQRAASDTTTIVRTDINQIESGQAITIEWFLIQKPDGFKVVDLNVGGVSLAIAQREEFGSAIQRNGGQVSMLTKMMRSKLTQMETAAQ